MNEDIRQLKLNNGDEILCEVLEWNSEDDLTIVIRRAYRIVTVEDASAGMRYFTFRPWMTYMDQPMKAVNLNASCVIAETEPTGILLDNYIRTTQAAQDTVQETENMSTEEEEKLEELERKFLSLLQNFDTDGTNEGVQLDDEARKKLH